MRNGTPRQAGPLATTLLLPAVAMVVMAAMAKAVLMMAMAMRDVMAVVAVVASMAMRASCRSRSRMIASCTGDLIGERTSRHLPWPSLHGKVGEGFQHTDSLSPTLITNPHQPITPPTPPYNPNAC
jgi:hypothetical protein